MSCYMVINGNMEEMDENLFDQMSEALHQPFHEKHVKDEPTQINMLKEDGTYDTKPLDQDYFKKYYRKFLKTPFRCPDCGRTMSSKTNLSKHRHTKICERHRCQ